MERYRVMELPHSKLREEYTNEIKVIEANIKDIASGDAPQELYNYSQNKLDKLAERFQYYEKLGTARYKLYELQAILYYFQNKDNDALAFIKQAIKMKGESYKRAEQLINQINDTPKEPQASTKSEKELTKAKKRKKLVGLDGWLAFFTLTLFISIVWSLFNLFKEGLGLSGSDISALNEYQPGLGDTFSTLTAFENVAVIVYIGLLIGSAILIFSRKKAAKTVAIAALSFGAIYAIADYAIVYNVLTGAGLSTEYISDYSKDVGRSIFYALIWVPYLLVSKRVKATLTK